MALSTAWFVRKGGKSRRQQCFCLVKGFMLPSLLSFFGEDSSCSSAELVLGQSLSIFEVLRVPDMNLIRILVLN